MLSLIMNLSYIALNVVFINLLHMGVLGMTIAVNVSRYAAAVCALIYLIRVDDDLRVQIRDMFYFNFAMPKKILFIGLPFAAEQMFFNGGKILTQIFIVNLGTYTLATNAICSSLANVFQTPANALALTIVTVVRQCLGRRNVKDVRRFTKSFIWLSSFSFIVMGLILMPLFKPMVSLFHPPAEIVDDIFIVMLMNTLAINYISIVLKLMY